VVWKGAYDRLCRDPSLGPLVRRVGPVRLQRSQPDAFSFLVRAVTYQQLAGKAAATIHGRFVDALGGEVTPERVLKKREATLREVGLSRNKLAAIRDLATKVRTGEVELHDLEEQPDEAVVARLVCVRGIGEWTAQMYLMFKLGRADVWPTGDLGVRAGYARIHGLDEPPTAKELGPLGDRFAPWRSAAAFYCWRALETELP
jgi:DNA-3-methyladenine glycosylase II